MGISFHPLLLCFVPPCLALQGSTDRKEKWYGAEYKQGPLPQQLLQRIERYMAMDQAASAQPLRGTSDGSQHAAALAGALGARGGGGGAAASVRSISHPGTFAASDDGAVGKGAEAASADGGGWQPVPGELHLPDPNWALPGDVSIRAGAGPAQRDWQQPPQLLLDEPGMRAWHRLDASYGIPKVCDPGGVAERVWAHDCWCGQACSSFDLLLWICCCSCTTCPARRR
jgi:hypothetical protein